MTPVINPWVFYLMMVADNLKVASLVAVFFLSIGIMISISDRTFKAKAMKIVIPIWLILLSILVFMPSSTTITKMLLAQNVTYERIETSVDIVNTVYNDIMALFK